MDGLSPYRRGFVTGAFAALLMLLAAQVVGAVMGDGFHPEVVGAVVGAAIAWAFLACLVWVAWIARRWVRRFRSHAQ